MVPMQATNEQLQILQALRISKGPEKASHINTHGVLVVRYMHTQQKDMLSFISRSGKILRTIPRQRTSGFSDNGERIS